jgi:hypothetical protein
MPGSARRLLIEAAVWLGIARALVLVIPYRRVVSLLRLQDQEFTLAVPGEEQRVISQVTRTIATISAHTPWESNCLVRAIAAKVMLRRRRINSTLYLGVKMEAKTLTAHAWLGRDRSVVIGDNNLATYTVVWTSREIKQ